MMPPLVNFLVPLDFSGKGYWDFSAVTIGFLGIILKSEPTIVQL